MPHAGRPVTRAPPLRPDSQEGVTGARRVPSDEPGSGETPGPDDAHEAVDPDQEMNEDGQGADMDIGFIGSLEPTVEDVVSEIMLQELGSSGGRYRRETNSSFKKLVSEIYSPPRVTKLL